MKKEQNMKRKGKQKESNPKKQQQTKKVKKIVLNIYNTTTNELMQTTISDYESDTGVLSLFVKTDMDVFVDAIDTTELTVDEISELFVDFINREEFVESEQNMVDLEVDDE